jgi:2-polyprenyl-3-methyl-5-hydroxy-6-metoxy-1,4-benzoquinol methylase
VKNRRGSQSHQIFTKYESQGDYHWQMTYGPWRRRSPAAHGRYDAALNLLQTTMRLADRNVLDLGCGDGVLCYKLCQRGATVYGVDASVAGLGFARNQLTHRGCYAHLATGSAFDIPFGKGTFDAVVGVEVIEHLDEAGPMLAEVVRVLRPDGALVLTTPMFNGQLRDPFHIREYTPQTLLSELAGWFASVAVYGQDSQLLRRLYHAPTRFASLNRLNAACWKAAHGVGINPFVLTTTRPSHRWNTLVAVCREPL